MRPLRTLLRRCSSAAVPAAAIAAVFLFLFRRGLFGGQFILVGDPLRQLYPLRMVAWEMIRSGTLPLWTPHLLSGYPLSAMVMLGVTYPVTWGYLFLPGQWAEQLYVLAPYLLAPLFTYAFLRETGRSRVASLLGGLSFGYGGFLFSTIGLTGVHANSALWLPLLLCGVARARRTSFIPALLLATFAFAMSILAGSGQVFLYAGSLAMAYGLFLSVFPGDGPTETRAKRWQPVAVAIGSIVLAAGLTAYQIWETWVATGLSVRRAYPPERFAEGSFTPTFAWHSLIQPLGNYWDSSTFVPLLALLLAFVAIAHAFTNARTSSQTFFWLGAAILSFLLILGSNTQLFALYSRIPFVSRFRYPSRHTLEWTFAIAVLAARGWDVALTRLRSFASRRAAIAAAATGIAIAAVAVGIAYGWSRYVVAHGLDATTDLNHTMAGVSGGYVGFKVAFTVAILIAVALFGRIPEGKLRSGLLAAAVAICCVVEPYLWLVRPVIAKSSVPAEQFASFGRTTQILRSLAGPHERIYQERVFSVPHPYAVPAETVREVDAVTWTALAGFHEVNGYESLIPERYSLAMRGLVDAEPFVYPDPRLLERGSHVLDLLNVRFVTAFTDFAATPGSRFEKDGITYGHRDLAIDLPRDRAAVLSAGGFAADSIALVSTMANSVPVRQGDTVAKVSIHLTDGRVIEQSLRGGLHTAEWAHDRPDVRATVLHERAPIFDSAPGDPGGTFESHRFVGRLALGGRVTVERVELLNVTESASVGLWKASLHDSESGTSLPLPQPSAESWRTVHEENGVTILENRNPLPRAWLVGKVERAGEEEILRRIRGEAESPFDPRSVALLEDADLPRLPGGLAAGSSVRFASHEPNRLRLQTESSGAAFLVVSELFYPGWVATVDGVETPIRRTDYLLRGVALPPGSHVVEMRYTAPAMRKGAVVSLVTLLLIVGAAILARRGERVTGRSR